MMLEVWLGLRFSRLGKIMILTVTVIVLTVSTIGLLEAAHVFSQFAAQNLMHGGRQLQPTPNGSVPAQSSQPLFSSR